MAIGTFNRKRARSMGHPLTRRVRSRKSAGVVALAKVNRVLRTREVRRNIVVSTAASVSNGGTIFHLCPITQGDTVNLRQGNRIFLQRLRVSILASRPETDLINRDIGASFRVIIFRSRYKASDVISGGINSYITAAGLGNHLNTLGFKDPGSWMHNKTIWDKTYLMPYPAIKSEGDASGGVAGGGEMKKVELNFRVAGQVEYNGNSGDAQSGSLFCILLPSFILASAGNNFNFTTHSMTEFVDA